MIIIIIILTLYIFTVFFIYCNILDTELHFYILRLYKPRDNSRNVFNTWVIIINIIIHYFKIFYRNVNIEHYNGGRVI